MRVAIVLIAAVWGIVAVIGLVLARHRSTDAKFTAVYILAYPALVVALFLNEPVAMWLAVPVVFGFIPWLMAGPHLWQILKDPSRESADEFIGIPRAYWLWGGGAALGLGFLFS